MDPISKVLTSKVMDKHVPDSTCLPAIAAIKVSDSKRNVAIETELRTFYVFQFWECLDMATLPPPPLVTSGSDLSS